MIVSDAIALLRNSELKQLSVKDSIADVLGFINLAILEIHKRFNLWEAEATITIVDGVLLYKLDGVDANVTIDLSDHELLRIESVWLTATEEYEDDKELILNNDKDDDSVFTPRFHQIKINTPVEDKTPYVVGDTMTATYRAAPLFLTNEKQEIPIPPQLLEALFNYVGFKGHGSIKSDIKGENNTHYIRFEAACERIKTEGLIAQGDLTSTKFENRGFV